jgi:hypothetical protein
MGCKGQQTCLCLSIICTTYSRSILLLEHGYHLHFSPSVCGLLWWCFQHYCGVNSSRLRETYDLPSYYCKPLWGHRTCLDWFQKQWYWFCKFYNLTVPSVEFPAKPSNWLAIRMNTDTFYFRINYFAVIASRVMRYFQDKKRSFTTYR